MRHVIHGGPDTFFTPATALLEILMGRAEGEARRSDEETGNGNDGPTETEKRRSKE